MLGTVINHEVITDKTLRCGLDRNIEDILINELTVSILLGNMPNKCLYTKCVPKYSKESWFCLWCRLSGDSVHLPL